MKPKVLKQNVGADMSKDDFKVCFYQLSDDHRQSIKGTRTFKNVKKDFKEFVNWAKKRQASGVTIRITLEATGVYYEQFVHFLHAQTDFRISVVLPNMSKAYGKSLNLKSKTDKIDAKMLGKMGLERDLSEWKPLSDNIFILKQLTRDRVSLLDEKTALSNKLHALNHSFQPHKDAVKRLKSRIRLIEKQVKEVEKQIAQTVKNDPILKERIEKVCKVKGLGLITVAGIAAETNGFTLFTSRAQITSYAGYDVVQRESGTSLKGKTRISKKGNRFIRRALHFPALVVVKHEAQFTQLFDRVLKRTGLKMKAYVAVQRKLLLLIYTLFKKNEAYDPNFAEKQIVQKNCRQDASPAYSG